MASGADDPAGKGQESAASDRTGMGQDSTASAQLEKGQESAATAQTGKGQAAGMGNIAGKELAGARFVASYSGGKDSLFAVYRAIKAGLVPAGLLTTYNTEADRSWFHGMKESHLYEIAASLGVPARFVKTTGEKYAENFEQALAEAKAGGAEACVFGDIDIEGHREWCTARCDSVGLKAYFPLWKEDRKNLVHAFIEAGFKTLITVVDRTRLPESLLGKTLDKDVAGEIARHGACICGENGEYHTFAYDGPLFSRPIRFRAGETVMQGKYAILAVE